MCLFTLPLVCSLRSKVPICRSVLPIRLSNMAITIGSDYSGKNDVLSSTLRLQLLQNHLGTLNNPERHSCQSCNMDPIAPLGTTRCDTMQKDNPVLLIFTDRHRIDV